MRSVHARIGVRRDTAALFTVASRPARVQRGKRLALACMLVLLCALLSGCAALEVLSTPAPAADTVSAGPNLGLLALPTYENAEAENPSETSSGSGYANVDLWLDATQNMGGISTVKSSMYPHSGRKYREGGFQYHYGNTVGWYESLLRDFLAAAGETHVRTLRYGNETLSDAFLAAAGLTGTDGQVTASVWRDLHTSQVDTNASFFSGLAGEDMASSFYALGSAAWVNRLSALASSDLENPTLTDAMSAALDQQIAGIAQKDDSFILQQGRDGEQCALLSALANIDTDKLSVITVDPASLRKTSGADAQGQPIAYYGQVLQALGVFDKGLCVGMLDFQLDYLGQLSTISTATLSEPLIWGHIILNEKKLLGVMPRRMLTLVIGTRARVDAFIQSLTQLIDADVTLKGLRGTQDEELSYAAGGQTVASQPFGFAWNATVIARPSMGYYSQHTEGVVLTAETTGASAAGATVATGENDVALVSLTPNTEGKQPDRTLNISFPLLSGEDGASLDVSRLGKAGLETLDTILLSQTQENTSENLAAAEANGQETVAYRDMLYLFSRGTESDAFSITSITVQNGMLVCTVAVNGEALKSGYYRLRLTADATGEQVAWESVPWIDGEQSVSASVTDADVYAWETFTAAITQFDRDSKGLPKMFRNAWGPYTTDLYHGLAVPACPPVYKSIHLAELAAQFRGAAAADESALIRCVFEVFVAYP
ncbi:MAG: hypothetical protein LLF96_06000 [Eubacteriales bacterium]|nr:hypothetical protein [Eubacteriales bacterium]